MPPGVKDLVKKMLDAREAKWARTIKETPPIARSAGAVRVK